MRLTEKQKVFINLVRNVWANRKLGLHGWFPYRNFYVAVEPYEDEGIDYINVLACSEVDALGYAFGDFFTYVDLGEDEIEDTPYLLDVFKEVVLKKNWHHGYY